MKQSRIIIMDDSQKPIDAHEGLKVIYSKVDSSTISKVPRNIQDSFGIFYSDMRMAEKAFNNQICKIKKDGSKDFDRHKLKFTPSLVPPNNQFIIEFQDSYLSLYFRSFMLLSKATLDRLIPFFDYKNGSNLRKFTNKGNKLINYLNATYKEKNKDDFVAFIKENQKLWIDEFINLRDKISHFGPNYEYISFHKFFIPGQMIVIDDIKDYNCPCIIIGKKTIDVESYISENVERVIEFSKEFLYFSFNE